MPSIRPGFHSTSTGLWRQSVEKASVRRLVATLAIAASLGMGVSRIAHAQNAVTDWANIVAPSINNASAPRPPASSEILHTIIQLAVYDAVVAIEGGYEPYAAAIEAPAGADVHAAVAAAAYRTARGRVASSQFAYLDAQYASYLAGVPDGLAKSDGIEVGEAAAAAVLALRASDGFNNVVPYACSAVPPPYAEFEPNAGCGTQPVDAKVGQITPFTFSDPAQFLPPGPDPLTSNQWVKDYNETRDYGRSNSSVRTAEQTDIAYFWAEHTYVHWNRNLNRLAIARGLDTLATARLLALAHTAASDAVIAGFHAKYAFRFVRPRTAIPRAAEDGNPNTVPDATWTPLLTVNHPEYPSAHAFWSTALTDAVARFFCGEEVTWTITTSQDAVPQVVQTQRTYTDLNAINRELDDARVWAGLHWRNSMKDGNKLGARVARHVLKYFDAGDDCDN
jgi:hypothetical protein